MAEQCVDGWQSDEVAFGDFHGRGTADAAGGPDGTGNRGGECEPDLMDWDRFYTYCDRVIVIALSRQPIQPADRDDCRQEIWANLLASRMLRYRGGSLAAWLTTLARNKAIDTIRRARRHPVGLAIKALERAVSDPAGPCPADEPAAVVLPALAELERRIEERSYAVFFLRWFDRQSFGQIAGALSLSPQQARAGTIARRRNSVKLSRARRSRPDQGISNDSQGARGTCSPAGAAAQDTVGKTFRARVTNGAAVRYAGKTLSSLLCSRCAVTASPRPNFFKGANHEKSTVHVRR